MELAALADNELLVHHFDLDPVADPEGQMTLISELDLVIQTSNASAHMAGMLGCQSGIWCRMWPIGGGVWKRRPVFGIRQCGFSANRCWGIGPPSWSVWQKSFAP